MVEQDPEVTVELLNGSFHWDTSARLLYAAAVALLAAPFVALIWAWRRWAIAADRGRTAAAILLMASMSYLLLLSLSITEQMIGPFGSQRRSTTIYVNLGLMVLLILLSTFQHRTVRRPLIVATSLTGVAWIYVVVISSVV